MQENGCHAKKGRRALHDRAAVIERERTIPMITAFIYIAIFLISTLIPVSFYFLHRRSEHSLDLHGRTLLATNLGFFNALYAFLLGFAVVTLWTQYINAKDSVVHEAQAINNLYHIAIFLPEADDLRTAIAKYNESLYTDEWPEMDRNRRMSEKSQALFQSIWVQAHRLNPEGDENKLFFSNLLSALQELSEHRMQRLLLLDGHLFPLIWFIIIIGGIFAIVGFYYTSTEKLKIQFLFDFIFISMIFLSIWLISELDSPFTGYVRITPTPFIFISERLKLMDNSVKEYKEQHGRNKRSSASQVYCLSPGIIKESHRPCAGSSQQFWPENPSVSAFRWDHSSFSS